MKWMGGWSVRDYENAPADLTDEIVALMLEEHQRYEDAKRGRRGGGGTQSMPEPRAVERSLPTFVDPRTGHEVITKHKDDGTIVQHRKIEDGEKILWALTGKRPKSFQGKL